MRIGGVQKFSLLDYPGAVCAVIFTQGCNFRCPFCHNPELVIPSRFGNSVDPAWVYDFLASRRGKLDGVTISGGEPTLQRDLLTFMRRIKTMSFSIKLDTNGSRPDTIRAALNENLVDFIAMDIKAPPASYASLAGVRVDTDAISESIGLIVSSDIACQFRTTVVPGLLTASMLAEIKNRMKQLKVDHIFQEFLSQ
jgi:pyruvate formate lyase activating enzyme